MSASQDPRNSWIYCEGKLHQERDKLFIAMLECEFDEMADQDVINITYEMKVEAKLTKFYRRLCIIRIFTLPTDFALGWIFLGKKQGMAVLNLHKVMWKYLFKKADRKDLHKAMSKFAV
jgi:hypothetical protein